MVKIIKAKYTAKNPQFIAHSDWAKLKFSIVSQIGTDVVVLVKGETSDIDVWKSRVGGTELTSQAAKDLILPVFSLAKTEMISFAQKELAKAKNSTLNLDGLIATL